MSKDTLEDLARTGTPTAFGLALLLLADAAAGRTALGLGTAATQATGAFDAAGAAAAAQAASQPLDSDLTAIAALTTTSFGRSLLAAADAAALRTLAGAVIGTDVAPARNSWHMPARLFTAGLGSAAFSGGSSSPVRYLMDASSAESIATVFEVPPGWTTMNVELWWCNDAGGSGDVVWREEHQAYTDGGNAGGADTVGSNTTDTAGTANVVVTTTLASGISVTAGGIMRLEIVRVATDSGDTLANDAAIISVKLIKAS